MADQRDPVERLAEKVSTNLSVLPKGKAVKKSMTLPVEAAKDLAKNVHGMDLLAAVIEAQERGLDAVTIYAEPVSDESWDIRIAEPSGVMVALMVPAYLQDLVALPGGEPAADLHVTLSYLGEAAEMSLNEQRRLIGTVGEVVRRHQVLRGHLGGTGRFTNGGETDPFWVGVDVPGLAALQADLHKTLTEAGYTPSTHGDYVPHVTVAYIPADADTPAVGYAPVEVCFYEVTVAVGGTRLAMALQPDAEQEALFESPGPQGWVPEAVNKAVDADPEERYTLGPWYIPDMLDAHGEWSDARELQKSFHRYLALPDRDIRLQHNTDVTAGHWVDGMVMPQPFTTTLTKADGTQTEHTFPAGTPFLGVKWEPFAWELIKAGKLRGYSIGGTSERIEVDLEQ